MTQFDSLGLSPQILAMLAQEGFETPTPIQAKAIPVLMEGRDMIGLAQTGTGKTAAFGLPLIERLVANRQKPGHREVRSLILAPTRELVNQIAVNLKIFSKKAQLRIVSVVGGLSINRQQEELLRGADILVATPGRLLDLCGKNALTLSKISVLVLDEADQMLDMGFIHDLKKIVRLVPRQRQTMLFSATMPKTIADLAEAYLDHPVRIEVTPSGKTADRVQQSMLYVRGKEEKIVLLRDMLRSHPDGRALIFGRTKHGSEKLAKHLANIGFPVASIHGNKSQGQRDRALAGFKDGSIKILVATDVAARGIDVPEVTHVYNYELPNVPEVYVHRIGRTARAGREGLAISFCTPDEVSMLIDIEKLTGQVIPTAHGERPEAADKAQRVRDAKAQGKKLAPETRNAERAQPRKEDGERRRDGRNGHRNDNRHETRRDGQPEARRPQAKRNDARRPSDAPGAAAKDAGREARPAQPNRHNLPANLMQERPARKAEAQPRRSHDGHHPAMTRKVEDEAAARPGSKPRFKRRKRPGQGQSRPA